jgi:hypothetical protein
LRAGALWSGRPLPRLTLVAALVLPLALIAAPASASDADEIPFNTAKILEFSNAERAARGVGPLSRDPRLDQHAQQLAETLAARGVLEHSSSYARTIGYPAGGQNLVYRGPSMNASQASYLWMTSDNHRKNLLNPGFTHAGVGIACSRASGRPYPVAVVDFGGQTLSPAVPPQNPIAVPHDALQGHALVCDGTSAAPPAPPPPPPAPAPVPPPAVTAPVAPKAAAPTPPTAPKAPAAAPAPMVPAPPPPPTPPTTEPAAIPKPMVVAAAPPGGGMPEGDKADDVLKQAAPVSGSGSRSVEGVLAFAVGCVGALVLAGVGGGVWFRRSTARATGRAPATSAKNSLIPVNRPADK